MEYMELNRTLTLDLNTKAKTIEYRRQWERLQELDKLEAEMRKVRHYDGLPDLRGVSTT